MIIIEDIAPQAPIHLLMIPKQHYRDITEATTVQRMALAGCLNKVVSLVDELGLTDGFRLINNKGANGRQSVGHLHIHILGGAQLSDKMG
jgi:histidine triad (HIT) family protein